DLTAAIGLTAAAGFAGAVAVTAAVALGRDVVFAAAAGFTAALGLTGAPGFTAAAGAVALTATAGAGFVFRSFGGAATGVPGPSPVPTANIPLYSVTRCLASRRKLLATSPSAARWAPVRWKSGTC